MPRHLFDIAEYGENVAAIAALLHEDREAYQRIYASISDTVGGFVGIWSLCAEAGMAFTEAAAPHTPGEDFEWIEVVESYVRKLMHYLQTGRKPTIMEMRRLAALAIEDHRNRR